MDFSFAMSQCKMPLVTIYDHPNDYPNQYVARLFDLDKPTKFIIVGDSLEELYAVLPTHRLTRITRNPVDDPQIVEVWL